MPTRVLVALLFAAFLGGMAAYVISVVRQAEPAPVKAECIDAELQDHIRKLALQALELAFQDRVQLLFDTWTKDPSIAKEHPHRAQVGMDNAIHAYVYAKDLASNWKMTPCEPKPVGVPR